MPPLLIIQDDNSRARMNRRPVRKGCNYHNESSKNDELNYKRLHLTEQCTFPAHFRFCPFALQTIKQNALVSMPWEYV